MQSPTEPEPSPPDAELILVRWATGSSPANQWLSVSEIKERYAKGLAENVSVGFVIQDDDEMLVLAATLTLVAEDDADPACTGVTVIPKANVRARKRLARASTIGRGK